MGCKIEHKRFKGVESLLGEKLFEIYKDLDKAKEEYDKISSSDFIDRFGDWINNDIPNRTNSLFEPLLVEKIGLNNAKDYYFLDKYGEKIDLIVREFSSFESDNLTNEIKEITEQIASYIFKKYIKENFDDITSISKINISNEIKEFTDNKVKEYSELLKEVEEQEDKDLILETIEYIGLIDKHNDEFTTEVINFFNSKKLKIDDDIVEEDLQTKRDEGLQGGDIIRSFERNTKDNATANVKLLMSFLPRYEFNKETNSFEKQYGGALGEELFVPTDVVHKELLKELADIVTLDNNTDVYKQMISVISALSTKKYYYKDLLDILNNISEDKRTEFVSAMFNTRINFYTSIKSGSSEFSQYKVFNSTEQRSKADRLLDEWFINFKNIYLTKGSKKYNVEKLEKTNKAFKQLIIALNKSRKGLDFNTMTDELFKEKFDHILINFIKAYNDLGITNITEQGFSLFLNRLNEDEMSYASIFNKIQGTLIKSSEMMKNIIDKPRNIKLNPFRDYKSAIFKSLSEAESFYDEDNADDTIRSGGKMYWTFGKPSYISNTVNKYKTDSSILENRLSTTYNKHSEFGKHLLGKDETISGDYLYDEKSRNLKSSSRLDNLELGVFNSVEEEGESINSDDNTEVSYVDQLVDEMNKVMQGGIKNKNGKLAGLSSIYSTSQAADKSTRYELKIDYFNTDTISSIEKSNIRFSNKILNIFKNYFLDELNRMKEAYQELESLSKEDYKVYYHSDKNGNIRNDKGYLIGNAFQSQIFPELSPTEEFIKSELNHELQLYSHTGEPLFLDERTLTKKQEELIKNKINSLLRKRLKINYDKLLKIGLLNRNTNESNDFLGYNIRGLDGKIVNSYKPEYETYLNGNDAIHLISDFTINAIIGNIEYTKLFTGDPAYYKNMVDFFKRVPATYTDGINLRLGLEEGDSIFNMAVVENQILTSKYIEQISKSLDESNMTSQEKDYVLKSYKEVNQTDAQAWITPQRWAFIIDRLGRWNSKYESVYSKMLGENKQPITEEELKYVAQPLKGVYFGVVNGVPTYLKYSQAVIYPSLVQGSQLEDLYNNMIKNGVDEAVTLDGVKVGATIPNKITDEEGNLLKDVDLNIVKLNNSEWKLQQDLPTKLIKDTLLGSQIQKNIYNSIDLNDDSVYTTSDGTIYNSSDILQEINDTISGLSNKGIEGLSAELGKDDTGRIDNDKFYSILEQELLEKEYPINMVKSIQKNLPIDSIPGIKDKMYNMLFSRIRKAAVKIKTNGGSFIQMSNFGLDKVNADKKGVTWLVEPEELKPPIIEVDLDGNKKVKPGQIFISHSEIVKYIPNYKELAEQGKLTDKLDDRLLRAIGYRIPNQGMSSNDPLQIVGILPQSMGDTIVAYTEIPTKTGSDFDIDKMYVMLPSSRFKDGKLSYIEYTESEDLNTNQLKNKLFELYWAILTNTNTYGDLITPIDFPHVKNNIKQLHGDNSIQTGENLKFYDSLYQLELKRKYISGKAGVGITANMLVDHVRSKTINLKFNNYYLGVGHKNSNNETIFDEEYSETLNGTKYKISHTISAFLNAFVDNAKDPYIDDGNYNTYTANVTFMLIRAGVHPDWINAFIGQPILKELVEFTSIYESKAIPKKEEWKSSFDVLFEKYSNQLPNKPRKDQIDKNIFTLEQLKNKIENKDNNDLNNIYQNLEILNLFKEFQNQSKKLASSVQLSRFDTEGAGKDYLDALIYTNQIKELLIKSNEPGELNGHIDKYVRNGKLTSLGTQVLNTLDYSRELMENNPNLFLLASENVTDLYNSISTNLINPWGGSKGLIKDKELAKKLNNELYSYIMSDLEKFKNQELTPSEYINNTIQDILDYKNSEADLEIDEKNMFIDKLEFFTGSFGIFSKNMSKEYKDNLYRAFRDLYENNPELTDKIIISSYLQNGFNRNIIDIREFIPHEWFIDNNIRGFFKQKATEINNGNFSNETFVKQLMQVNNDDNILIPKITKRTYSLLSLNNKKLNINDAFTVDTSNEDNGYNRYVLGKDKSGVNLFTDYLKLSEDRVYELQGYINNQPVYTRINTLGLKKKQSFLNIREYKYNELAESSYKSNNTSDVTKLLESLNSNPQFMDKSLFSLVQDIQEIYTKNLSDILLSEINVVSLEEDFNSKDNDTPCPF